MNLKDANRPGPAVLIVIDLQEVFLQTIPNPETVLKRCSFACAAANLLGIPVLFTEQVPDKLGNCHPALRKLSPQAPVFGKSAFSALKAEGVGSYLREREIEHLLLAGLETSVCVYQTTLEALRSNFSVTLLSDCIGARRSEDERVVLSSLRREKDLHLLPSETVFYSLLGSAENKHFRSFNNLVKQYG